MIKLQRYNPYNSDEFKLLSLVCLDADVSALEAENERLREERKHDSG